MRRKYISLLLIMGIVLILSLVGCKSKKIDENTENGIEEVNDESSTPIEEDKEKIINDFRNIVKSDNEPYTIVKFIDENIEKVEKEEAVEMIRDLEEVQEEYLTKYTDQLFMEDYQMELLRVSQVTESREEDENDIQHMLFFDTTKTDQINNGNLKELIDKIIKGKYKLINMEGAFYPIIDYEELKAYNKYFSDEMKDYLDIKSMDSNMPTILDAEFLISFDELSERLITVENYIVKYPEGLKYEEVLRLYGAYLRLYLEGSDNTPIYDFETNKIRDDVLSSYKKTGNIKDTVTSKIVNKYINIIEENQNLIDNQVFSKITELHNEAIGILEESK